MLVHTGKWDSFFNEKYKTLTYVRNNCINAADYLFSTKIIHTY